MALLRRAAASLQQSLTRYSSLGGAGELWCLGQAAPVPTPASVVSLLPLRAVHQVAGTSSSAFTARINTVAAAAAAAAAAATQQRSATAAWQVAQAWLRRSRTLVRSGSNWELGTRGYASSSLTPKFTGGKLKPYSSYKGRFKMTGAGNIRYMRPGHVHKRFNKSKRQLNDLSKTQLVQETYAKVMRRLGFVSRSF